MVVVARGIIDSCQMSSSGVAYSGWIGPNTDVSLFTDLDTRKIEPIMCRNFVILLLWFLSGAGSVGLLGCDGCELGCCFWNDACKFIFFKLAVVGALGAVLYPAPSSGDDSQTVWVWLKRAGNICFRPCAMVKKKSGASGESGCAAKQK